MKVLITGGAGFIGSHIADACIARGHRVAILDDLSSGTRSNLPAAAEFHHADLADPDAVERVVGAFRPEVVSHQAAQASVSHSVRDPAFDARVNILGGLHLLLSARRAAAARFVFASTGGAIYGDVPGDRLADVDSPLRPESPYAVSKLSFEHHLRAEPRYSPLKTTVLRYANVYGPRQNPHGEAGVVAIFMNRIAAGEPIQVNGGRAPGDGGCIRDYVFVDDVVAANLAAIEGGLAAPLMNVCTGVGTTTSELAERIGAVLGKPVRATDGAPRAGDVFRSVLAPAASAAPTGLESGLRKTADWMLRRAR